MILIADTHTHTRRQLNLVFDELPSLTTSSIVVAVVVVDMPDCLFGPQQLADRLPTGLQLSCL